MFSWDKQTIDDSTCDIGNYYCDQEQLLKSLEDKFSLIENNDYIEISKIKYKSDGSVPEKKKDIDFVNLCSKCENIQDRLENTDDIDDYLDASYDMLNNIDKELRKMTLIEIDSQDDLVYSYYNQALENENVKKEDGKVYFNLNSYFNYLKTLKDKDYEINDYIDNEISNNTTDIKNNSEDILLKTYRNMDVFLGVGLNKSIVGINEFGDLDNQTNEAVFESDFFDRYTYKLSNNTSISSVSKPGYYLIELKNPSGDILEIKFETIIDSLDEFSSNENKFSENAFFYNPINPNTFRYEKNGVPFIKTNNRKDYYQDWEKMQKGFVFTLDQKISGNYEYPKVRYMDLRPVILEYNESKKNNYSVLRKGDAEEFSFNWYYIKDNELDFVTPSYSENKNEFVLNTDSKENYGLFYALYEDPSDNKNYQIKIVSDKEYSPFFNEINEDVTSNDSEDKKYVYTIENKYNPLNTKIETIKNLINEIKYNNVCFKTDSDNIDMWFNPNIYN